MEFENTFTVKAPIDEVYEALLDVERVAPAMPGAKVLEKTGDGAGFYERRGWKRWLGPTSAITPAGVVRTPDDHGSVYVRAVGVRLHVERELTCDWRGGDLW